MRLACSNHVTSLKSTDRRSGTVHVRCDGDLINGALFYASSLGNEQQLGDESRLPRTIYSTDLSNGHFTTNTNPDPNPTASPIDLQSPPPSHQRRRSPTTTLSVSIEMSTRLTAIHQPTLPLPISYPKPEKPAFEASDCALASARPLPSIDSTMRQYLHRPVPIISKSLLCAAPDGLQLFPRLPYGCSGDSLLRWRAALAVHPPESSIHSLTHSLDPSWPGDTGA